MLKLALLRIRGFRGFNDLAEIAFDDGLNVIYGPNGFGKTSIAEAVEWVLFGRTSRLENSRSKSELRDSLRNVHCPKSERAFVELTLYEGNVRKTVRRELIDDDHSIILIDGRPTSDLSFLGISWDGTPNPVLAQHALTDFIHTEPVNRWKALSQFLGLERVASFRAALRTSITELENQFEIPLSVVSKWEAQAQANGWTKLHTAIKRGDEVSLVAAVTDVLQQMGADPADDVTTLESRRQALLSSALEVPSILQQASMASGMPPIRIETLSAELRTSFTKLIGEWPIYIGLVASDVTAKELAFISAGLNLPPSPPRCPFCGKETLSEQHLADLQSVVGAHSQLLQHKDSLQRLIETVRSKTQEVIAEIRKVVALDSPQAAAIEKLRQSVDAGLGVRLVEFNRRVAAVSEGVAKTETALNTLLTDLSRLLAAGKDDPALWRGFSDGLTELEDYAVNAQGIPQVAKDLYSALAPVLAARVAENAAVRSLGEAVTLLKEMETVRIGLHVRATIQDAKRILADVEQYEQEKTEERLAEKETDALSWYNMMNPSEPVRFSKMEVARQGRSRQVQLFGESYGKRVQALALLSESHLNALGLSVHLARAVSDLAPLRFVILDDPVQSMDQAHSNRVASSVIRTLIHRGWQVIVLSHLFRFSDYCVEAHGLDRMDEIGSYQESGPMIEPRETGLRDYLERATKLKDGNSVARTDCAHIMRKAVERFCKDVYSKGTGNPVPKRFQDKPVRELKKLAIDSGKLSGADLSQLEEILQLGNPSSHDDQVAEPPTSGELNHALSLLKGLVSIHLKK